MGNKVDVFASNTSTYTPGQLTPNRKYIVTNTVLQQKKTGFNILSSYNKPETNKLRLSATHYYRNMFSGDGIDAKHHGMESTLAMMTNNKSNSKHLPNDIKDEYIDEKNESNRFLTFFKRISDLQLTSETKEESVIYISEKMIEILSEFWVENIELQTADVQLEIGCAIFFGMIASNKDIRKLFLGRKFGPISMQFLDMMAWLIRMFMDHKKDQSFITQALIELSCLHLNMGIKQHFYGEMLRNIHETMQYYYPQEYTLQVKYAMDKMFVFAACILSNGTCNLKFAEKIQLFGGFSDGKKNVPAIFLSSVDRCLQSSIGREFLYMFLTQTYCDEIAVFLQLLFKFEHQITDKERFMTARNIVQTSIDPNGELPINISYEVRKEVLLKMKILEKSFVIQEKFEIKANFFFECYFEVKNLVLNNQWTSFVKQMKALQMN